MISLPSSMLAVLELFAPLFSRPTFRKGILLMAGHLLCRKDRTITNFLRLLGLQEERRYSKFHDVIRKAKWSAFQASKILLLAIDRQWLCGPQIRIAIDTTLERRRGPKIHGLGMHRDAVRSTRTTKVFSPGHNWLVVCVLIQFPGTKQVWSLPFLSILLRPMKRLASSKNLQDLKGSRRHKKVTTYARQVVCLLRRWLGPNREIVLVADSAFCCKTICRACIRQQVLFCSHFRLNASLYDFPPKRKGGKGRPRVVGQRLPNLGCIAADPLTKWRLCSMSWYGGGTKELEVCTGTCLWYHNSCGRPIHIQWTLTRDPGGEGEVTPLLCTGLNATAAEIIEHYVGRWSIETTFQELRAQLGFESTRTWADQGIERMAPAIIASFSLTCLIAAKSQKDRSVDIEPISTAWYQKRDVTFSDILSHVRLLILNENIIPQAWKQDDMGESLLQQVLSRMIL